MAKINEKVKSYINYGIGSAQERIGLLQKTNDVVLELDKHNLESSYIKEKPHKVIVSVGKYNLVVQEDRDKIIYLVFNFETKERILNTSSFDVLKQKIGEFTV